MHLHPGSTHSQGTSSPQTVVYQNPSVCTSSDPVSSCRTILSPFTSEEKLNELLVECSFSPLVKNFLELACKGMEHLRQSKRSNVIYNLVRGLGTMRNDGSDSLLPTKRMPMGLLEHVINFFVASSIQKVLSFVSNDCNYL